MKYASLLWIFCLVLSASGETTAARERTFYGMNSDTLWNFKPEELPLFVEMLTKTKCGSVRLPIRWRVLEPKKGEWDFAAMDRMVQSVPKDVDILGTIMSVPSWANGIDPERSIGWFDTYAPRNFDDWKNAIKTTVSHYKGRIKYWEIWNEENGVDFYRPTPDVAAYSELLKIAYQAAKEADPACVVVLGGLQMNGIIPNPWSDVKTSNYLEDLYKAGAKPYFDICNIHPYVEAREGAEYMMKLTKDTLDLMSRYGDADKPLWITEVGCGAPSPEAEQAQATLLEDTFRLTTAEPRIQRVYWFMLRDMEKDLVGPESTMGVFKLNGVAKPALEAIRRAQPSTAKTAAGE